ncbi:MAG TPA: PEP-CTERM system histidine kinase PrsK, partial [Nitrospira sp.]|nr:PEP-CTERM system histidine kinase PrsK [Nitrospira sp.]
TFLVVGFYLFVVGVVSQIVRSLGVPSGVTFSVLFVWLALVGLVVFLLSRSARAALRTVVARNFYRSKYDYRAQWLEVTKVFRDCDSVDAIWDRLLRLLSRTFYASRISVWHRSDTDTRFHQVRSTNTESAPAPLDASHGLIQLLAGQDGPMAVDTIGLPSLDGFVQATHAVLCTPIHSGAELTGFIALSHEVAGLPYGQDDRDLLKAIAHHVGVLLAHARLAEERQGSAELEALHRFSAFCLHDLKNLAARLSLVVQNAEHHGLDPAFQESAMRTIKDTTHKMMALMEKLALRSVKPPLSGIPEAVELLEVINEVVASLKDGTVRWQVSAERVQPLIVVREEIHQVVLNILLNAKQAITEEGTIWITLSQVNGAMVVTVQDTGCGILEKRLQSLFRPAQTSRQGGLGIGLYQCKQIIEAYRGTIQIQSKVGQGTVVRIELPVSVSSVTSLREDSVHTAVSL